MDVFNVFRETLGDTDPISFVERVFYLRGTPMKIRDTGRDYLFDYYNYLAYEAPKLEAKPVITLKGRQVEMTTTAICIVLYYLCSGSHLNCPRFTHFNVLYTFPRKEQAQRFYNDDTKLRGFMNNSRKVKVGSTEVPEIEYLRDYTRSQTMGQTTFKHGNQLFLGGAWGDADSLRSITSDCIVFDEIQDLSQRALNNTRESATVSRYNIELGFGTPLLANSEFDRMWQKSNQQYYHFRCPSCEKLYWLNIDNWKRIWKTGFTVTCPHCGKDHDKRKAAVGGQWIAMRTNDITRVGFHFSQLIHPAHSLENLLRKESEQPRMTFVNEVMGEFYAGLTRPLTFAELMDSSAKPFTTMGMEKMVLPPRQTFMGVDWGGSSSAGEEAEGALTCVCIMEPVENGMFRVVFAHKFVETSFDEQVNYISEWIRIFNVKECVADIGFGHVQVYQLQCEWGDRVKGCYYTGGQAKSMYSYNKDKQLITVDRNGTLEVVYDELANARWQFPYREPEKVEWLVEHCTNVEIETRLTGGMARKVFNKPYRRRNDGLMALNYARIAYQFQRSNGFNQYRTRSDGKTFPKAKLARFSLGSKGRYLYNSFKG